MGSAGRGETRYSIRGGSQDEIKWFFDGVRTASLVNGRADWGGSFTNLEYELNSGSSNNDRRIYLRIWGSSIR
ncbi:MAG: hypothetical protein MZV64_69275 [Ignavibacteriales bacterium]|nr:hypothetical protein [Ignavibacteriales bacterium]